MLHETCYSSTRTPLPSLRVVSSTAGYTLNLSYSSSGADRVLAGPFLREIDAWNAMFMLHPGARPRGLVQDCHP